MNPPEPDRIEVPVLNTISKASLPSRRERRRLARLTPAYKAYRNANRPYRRAFGRGERWRNNLLACAESKLKGLS